ncbi:MAG TPA: helix-turn-helix transcriptional regulator [Anaerolineales bacterium]|nr:helix-turn-helix transcriptional regulator [Anaerolineales bacterium]
MTQPESEDLQEFQDFHEFERKVGYLIKKIRLGLGISAQELAARLNYDPSLISKVENGKNISITFIDKLLLLNDLDEAAKAELNHCREILDNLRIQNAQNETGGFINAHKEQSIKRIDKTARLKHLQVAGVLFLALAIIAGSTWWYSSTHKKRHILGTIDFGLACIEQYPDDPDVSFVLFNEHNVNSWKCKLTKNGVEYAVDIDAMTACRAQYSTGAIAAYKDPNDAYSWYCYLP